VLMVSTFYEYRSYKNSSAVQEEVKRIQGRKNLLLWYTADESVLHFYHLPFIVSPFYGPKLNIRMTFRPDGWVGKSSRFGNVEMKIFNDQRRSRCS
jgi:hypothetical protein